MYAPRLTRAHDSGPWQTIAIVRNCKRPSAIVSVAKPPQYTPQRMIGEGHIGVDESGKGDYFGPLVIAAVYVGPEHLAAIEGVKDSKKLSDAQVKALAPKIVAACPHTVIPLKPELYNKMYADYKNLNHLLAWGHAKAIEGVLEQQPATRIISDEFAKGGAPVKSRLGVLGKKCEFVSRVRAESDPAVAAASILARAAFLRILESLSQETGVALPKGATVVLPTARKYVALHGRDALGRVAKLHFKTTLQV